MCRCLDITPVCYYIKEIVMGSTVVPVRTAKVFAKVATEVVCLDGRGVNLKSFSDDYSSTITWFIISGVALISCIARDSV